MTTSADMAYRAAIAGFWGLSGLPVYRSGAVPRGAEAPYVAAEWPMPRSRSETEACCIIRSYGQYHNEADKAVDALCGALPVCGRIIRLAGGAGVVRITRGNPFIDDVPEDDPCVHTRRINIRIWMCTDDNISIQNSYGGD